MRLIDADALLIDLNNFVSYETAYEYEEVKECVLSAPTIEAELIRHGHWISHRQGEYICSNCNSAYYDLRLNYCGSCGAKMDKEV